MITTSRTSRRSSQSLTVGPFDLADTGRPPHPGGRPCGGLCVAACATDPSTTPLSTATRGAQP